MADKKPKTTPVSKSTVDPPVDPISVPESPEVCSTSVTSVDTQLVLANIKGCFAQLRDDLFNELSNQMSIVMGDIKKAKGGRPKKADAWKHAKDPNGERIFSEEENTLFDAADSISSTELHDQHTLHMVSLF